MTGVLLIALKSPIYGRMAYNLMQSIKAVAPDMPVSIVLDEAGGAELDAVKRFYFDKIITPDPAYYVVSGQPRPLVAKFHLYDLSPYKKTLFMDADTILSTNCDFKAFLSELDGIEFTMANRGEGDMTSQWTNKEHIVSVFNPDKFYDLSSEVIYFERCETAKKVFKTARKLYNEGRLETKPFAGDKPDEPFFAIAMDKNKIYPHQSPWKPLFWAPQEGYNLHNIAAFGRKFIGMSAGGRHLPKLQLKLYTQLCGAVEYATKATLFPYLTKYRYLPERTTI